MEFFHATYRDDFDYIDKKYSKKNNDFGEGLYLSTNIDQAIAWARKKLKKKGKGVIYVSDFNINKKIFNELSYEKNERLFNYIYYNCRNKTEESMDLVDSDYNKYDVIYGPMIDDVNQFEWALRRFHGKNIKIMNIKNLKITIKENSSVFINSIEELATYLKFFDKNNYQYCLKSDPIIYYFNRGIKRIILVNKNGNIKTAKTLSFDEKNKKIIY